MRSSRPLKALNPRALTAIRRAGPAIVGRVITTPGRQPSAAYPARNARLSTCNGRIPGRHGLSAGGEDSNPRSPSAGFRQTPGSPPIASTGGTDRRKKDEPLRRPRALAESVCTPNIRPNLPDFGKSVATTPSISEGAGMSEPTELSDLVAYLVRTSRLTRSDAVRLVE